MELLTSLWNVVVAVVDLLVTLASTLWPWAPLIAWIAFWTLAVDWVKLRSILWSGGIIGVLLIALVAVLVWGCVAPPADGSHFLFGLQVSNFVGKFVYVTGLLVIVFLCGAVQLSGCCDRYCAFPKDADEPAVAH
ncbi:hypothetical protein Mal4_21770 [Maioricimonas rarisocia]|uniref:Uncharacterized protein n=1 Tax=Maioricimonas rarisocia TaxID=2528026 RepID=A0A517Z5U2_9PLAN|nr:hypothetical protein [Maioricimonas rarisocia]QDU37860.1 hypothetical protein Mal4_21770 [Maioricimonas rarisocia]